MVEEYVYKKIGSIIFGMLSPDTIKKMSTAKIVTPELYDKEGYPVDGGLMDVRLGVIDPGLRCKTCGGKLKECIGHFGHVDLARPVVHLKYIDIILISLRSTCRECGKLLAAEKKVLDQLEEIELDETEGEEEATKKQIRKFRTSVKSIKKCPHCKAKQFSIKIEKPTTMMEDDKRISPLEIKKRLEKISDSDIEILGLDSLYARPDWGILSLLPVPPVTIRPSITLQTGERSEDDLTHKLGDIVRINQRLFENINAGAPEIIVEDLWDLLQYHINTYFDNEISQVPPARHRSGQPLKTLSERIKSKEGRFRHNLAGKRVNYAARTVISPDSKIELNEVGVPLVIALDLTVPERVTEWNIKRLKKYLENGPTVYPGCNYVVRPDGKKKRITEETHKQLIEELQPGFIVERHLMDNDIAIFNRQPSLHKMSIMAHRVKVIPGKSFRLNPCVCSPYGADFDGDEMNLHVPQTEEARAEAEILMEVQTQIITPKNGLNVIGCAADPITGNYLLTKNMTLNKDEAVQILMNLGIDDIERLSKFKETVSGKEVFSALLPDDFNFTHYSRKCGKCEKQKKDFCDDDLCVMIKNGKMLCGIIDKKIIGVDSGSLIRALYSQYGEDKGIKILGKIFRLGIEAITFNGFTTSIADTDLPQETISKYKEILSSSERRVAQYIEQYENKEMSALPGLTVEETLEINILQTLNKTRNKVGEAVAEVSNEKNPLLIMSSSGAKGNLLNLAMMSACVGQQSLRGKRIPNGYKNRTLSLFKKGDLSPKSRGFIRSGYRDGLDHIDFFIHAMTGRDSLMDTALRTPKSGYLYRRLSSALQDIKIDYDNTVRDGNENILQFEYGEDSLDITKTEGGKINIRKIVDEVIKKK